MNFFYIKAAHIIFVVTWFSGMFYLCRLFIYQREAHDRPENERKVLLDQFSIMTRRLLFGITLPSAILTLILGTLLLLYYAVFPEWLWFKLVFVLILFAYHFSLHHIYKLHKKNLFKFTSQQLRLWNEVPTVLLVSIVMLVIVKEKISVLYGLLALFLLVILLFTAIKWYKRLRGK